MPASLPKMLKSLWSETVGFSGMFFWRTLERLFSVEQLLRLARAWCGLRAMLNERFKCSPKPYSGPEWLPQDCSPRARSAARRKKYLDEILLYLPDRLSHPQWQKRCLLEGDSWLRAAQAQPKPVVVVFFHVGPIHLLRVLLRAAGVRCTGFVRGEQNNHSRWWRYLHRLSPMPEIPSVLYDNEVRAMVDFLKAKQTVFIALDNSRGQRFAVATEDGWEMQMNSGPARLAFANAADMVPCCIIREGDWRYRIQFWPAIPAGQLAEADDWKIAYDQALNQILPTIKKHPDQFARPHFWRRPATTPDSK